MLQTSRSNPKILQSSRGEFSVPPASTTALRFQRALEFAYRDEEDKGGKSKKTPDGSTRTFSHIEVAPILTLERPACEPVDGLDSNQSHAFPLSARPLALGRTL